MHVTYNDIAVDAAQLLLALYHGTQALGMGRLQDSPNFCLEDAEAIIEKRLEGAGAYGYDAFDFDYVLGRPIKIRAIAGVIHTGRLYDRDAGSGAFEAAFLEALEASTEN